MPVCFSMDSGRTDAPQRWRCCVLLAAGLWLAACGDQSSGEQRQGSAAPPPPPEVEVVTVSAEDVPVTRELVGRLASSRIAEVRARVAGIILEQVYTEGTDVRAGDVLFRIDPKPLKVEVLAQQAALAKARADAEIAAQVARRFRDLANKGLASKQELDNALANESSTRAAVGIAEANLEAALLDLDYATVRAPIAGRAGRALVNEGALVGQDEATVLTTVEQIDPIRVNFSLSLAELEQLRQLSGGAPGQDRAEQPLVEVYLKGSRLEPHRGRLDFTDLAADPATGAVSLRAVVANPERRLLPGTFVNLRLTLGQLRGAYVVPQAAVLRDAQGAYVLTVDGGGNVQQRHVQLQTQMAGTWAVTGGLNDGDRVILAGLQKVMPGGQARVAPAGDAPAPGAAQGQQ